MEKLTTDGMVQKTTNYDIFKLREDNRGIDEAHVRKLIRSLEVFNNLHLKPIIVNSEMEVIDGQHRLMAAKQMNLPIYYTVDDDYDPKKMILLNSAQLTWRLEDYANFWMQNGRNEYKKLLDFCDETGFKLPLMLEWLANKNDKQLMRFKEGGYKHIVKEDIFTAILCMKRLIDTLKKMSFKPVKIYMQRPFNSACKEFFRNPLVDIERFFKKLEYVPFQIRASISRSHYLEQLLEIYNYRMKDERLRLLQDGEKTEIVL